MLHVEQKKATPKRGLLFFIIIGVIGEISVIYFSITLIALITLILSYSPTCQILSASHLYLPGSHQVFSMPDRWSRGGSLSASGVPLW